MADSMNSGGPFLSVSLHSEPYCLVSILALKALILGNSHIMLRDLYDAIALSSAEAMMATRFG